MFIFALIMRKALSVIIPLMILSLFSCGGSNTNGYNDETDKEARQYVDSALVYIDRQDFRAAMLQLKKAEKLLPELTDKKVCYQICQYIGWIDENSGANELALQYQQQALGYAQEYGKPEYMVDVLINQANVLFNMNQNDSAWRVNTRAAGYYKQADRSQQSVILKNTAYYEMLKGSLSNAERHAYRAAMLAEDSSAIGNAQSLLCQIYIKQNRYEKAQMLMSIMPRKGNSTLEYNMLLVRGDILEKKGDYKGALESCKQLKSLSDSLNSETNHLDIVKIQNQYDKEVIQREKAEQKLYFSIAIITLLLIIFALTIWYNSHAKSQYRQYRQRIATVKEDTMARLGQKNSTIEEMKQAIDEKVAEIDILKRKLPEQLRTDETYDSIADTKMGVDVLYAILKDQNISQMGKQEQRVVTDVMWTIDRSLAVIISNPDYALTPKETFFCIMERNGKNDQQKATSFCCTEQAIRSTKSRLGKKMDLGQLSQID